MAPAPNPCRGGGGELATVGDVSVFASDTDFIERNDVLQNPVEKLTLLSPFLGPVSIFISAREVAGRKAACSGIIRGLRWEK